MAPSARVACGSVVDVSVKLADDMGRTVHPTSDVRVSLAFRKPPTTGVVASPDDTACGHEAEGDRSGVGECMHDGMAVITGASSFDDPLLSLDDSWDGDDDDDADESTHIGLYSSRYSRCQHTSTCILRACSTQNRPYMHVRIVLHHHSYAILGNQKCSQLANYREVTGNIVPNMLHDAALNTQLNFSSIYAALPP